MRYKFIDNGSGILIIMFQSVGQIPKDQFKNILENTVSDEEIEKYHSKYNYMKIVRENPQFDYLFVQDYYSRSYGWYLVDSGKFIFNELNDDLEEFTKKYEYVYAFGSSKGGSGALIYGNLNKYITHTFALVPQIEIAKFVNQTLGKYKSLLFGNDIELDTSDFGIIWYCK